MAFDKFFKKIKISQGEPEDDENEMEEAPRVQQPAEESESAGAPLNNPQPAAGIAEALGNSNNRGSNVVDIASTSAGMRGKSYTKSHSVREASANMKVVVIQPRSLDDSQQIANSIKDKQPVVVNFEGVDDQLYRRILDFISGTAYALDGSVVDIGARVWLCSPKNINVSKPDRKNPASMPWEKND